MLANDHLSLRLVRIRSDEEWTAEGERLSFVFPKAGTGSYLAGLQAQSFGPGDVLVLNGDSRGRIVSQAKGGELVFWWFGMTFDNLMPLFAANEISLAREVSDGFKDHKHYPATMPLASECHKLVADVPPQFDLAHRGQLLRVAASILSLEFKSARGQRSGFVRMDEHITRVLEQLSVTEILELSVGELAGKFGCSRRHLNRLFHQYFDLSVAALRMEMRLLKAIALLRDSDAKIIHVAEQCGFNHLGLFNTCFKRRFGVSPGKWRKRLPRDSEQPSPPGSTDDNCRLRMMGLCPWGVDMAKGACPGDDGASCEERPGRSAGETFHRDGGANGNGKLRPQAESGVRRTLKGAPTIRVRVRP